MEHRCCSPRNSVLDYRQTCTREYDYPPSTVFPLTPSFITTNTSEKKTAGNREIVSIYYLRYDFFIYAFARLDRKRNGIFARLQVYGCVWCVVWGVFYAREGDRGVRVWACACMTVTTRRRAFWGAMEKTVRPRVQCRPWQWPVTLIRSNFYEATCYGSMHICSISFFIINIICEEMVIGDRWTEMMAFYSIFQSLHST